ncbi:uncharacterized protein [Haliotis asinina]|uniref:uncharacterized protein n=1 Tax=Haliotis asinina TaxID=109174 RepID=UPI003531BBE2
MPTSTTTTIRNTNSGRRRHSFTKAQLNKLEAAFKENDGYIGKFAKDDLAQELDMNEVHVRIWFQNRRARAKRQIKPTSSLFAHPIQSSEIRTAVAQSPAMETTIEKESRNYRKLFDLSNLQPSQSIINTGRCFELSKKVERQQNGLNSNPCYTRSHTTDIRKPEVDSLSSVAVSLDETSENTCKFSASDVSGVQGKPKLDTVSHQISVEAPGIVDKHASSPLMVYNVQKFSPTAVPRVLPVKENPREHCDDSHVKKTGTTHFLHVRPSRKVRKILPKPVLSPPRSERQGGGQPQDDDGCSNVPSPNEQLFHSGNSSMCLPHVPMSTQLPPMSVVPDEDTRVQEGFTGEITFEPKEHEHLNNSSRQEPSRSVDTTGIQHHVLDKDAFFSAMCELDTNWTPLPDDVAVMFNSYRDNSDCSGGVDITEATEPAVMEKNVYLPIRLC